MIRAPEREAAPLAEVSRPATGQRRRALAQVVAPMIVFALVVGVWLFISYVLLEPRRRFLMPPPQEVVRIGFFDARNLSEILGALWSTTQVAIVGLLVAIAIGTIARIGIVCSTTAHGYSDHSTQRA